MRQVSPNQPSHQDIMIAVNSSASHSYVQGWHLDQTWPRHITLCLLADSHIRRWRGWWLNYYCQQGRQRANRSSSLTSRSRLDTWGHFHLLSSRQNRLFIKQSCGHFHHFFVVIKTGFFFHRKPDHLHPWCRRPKQVLVSQTMMRLKNCKNAWLRG